jgi:hypothetical protein
MRPRRRDSVSNFDPVCCATVYTDPTRSVKNVETLLSPSKRKLTRSRPSVRRCRPLTNGGPKDLVRKLKRLAEMSQISGITAIIVEGLTGDDSTLFLSLQYFVTCDNFHFLQYL